MTSSEDEPVVIGVDELRSAANAVRWGIAFAERHGSSVRLVRSYDPSASGRLPRDDWGHGREEEDLADLARMHLANVRRRAAEEHPDLVITASLVEGSAAATLINESAEAGVIILGVHGRTEFSTLLAGATTMNVATQAQCPVVAVPGDESRAFGGTGIVVGVDGSASSQDALGFAFQEADNSKTPLTAVFAWMGSPDPGGSGAIRYSERHVSRILRAAGEQLELRVDSWAQKYPGVSVTKRVIHAHPVRALVAASTGAQLLVVGCRGNAATKSLILGSVSHGVLHLATVPVAVVHEHH